MSFVFGLLPATVGLFFSFVILFLAIPLLRFSTEPIRYYQVVFCILWIVSAVWGYIELYRVSLSRSLRPSISIIGLVLGIFAIVFFHEVFNIIFNEPPTGTKPPLLEFFNPSLDLIEAYFIACPTLVALYHITMGNASIWRAA